MIYGSNPDRCSCIYQGRNKQELQKKAPDYSNVLVKMTK